MGDSGILSDLAIRRAIECGEIEIDPFEPANVNPVSVDLTLGDEVLVYKDWATPEHPDVSAGRLIPGGPFNYIDVKKKPLTRKFKIDELGYVLMPGIGYLMHTCERIRTNRYVPVLDGKSSVGRLFMFIHVTAGYGDPGFDGQYTLEVHVVHPLKIYPGMRIAQMRFHTIAGELGKSYAGNYTGESAKGPVASKAYRQFK